MRTTSFLALCLASAICSSPGRAQTAIPAPSGWTTQTKANGATTFTPPDLRAGEKYSMTVYESAPLNGQTPGDYLRKFAGPVGTKAGQLAAPLKIQTQEEKVASGIGAYVGPNGAALGVFFVGSAFDGAEIQVIRTLFSDAALLKRYEASQHEIVASMLRRDADAKAQAQSSAAPVPRAAAQVMASVGGDLVPGVYAGERYRNGELRSRLRIYIYANGEYRICNENDQDVTVGTAFISAEGIGRVAYERGTGKINIGESLENNQVYFCLYGRDSAGKPLIYQKEDSLPSLSEAHTFVLLNWVGPPTKRLSPSAENARKADQGAVKQAKADAEQAKEAKAAQAERRKFALAPGKGLRTAQIAAILYSPTLNQYQFTREYLLLKDGTIYDRLPEVAIDEFNAPLSKQKEPQKWGRWRRVKGDYQASWEGKPFEALYGFPVVPAPAPLCLSGHYGGGIGYSGVGSVSWTSWGTTFDKKGRFREEAGQSNTTNTIGMGPGSSISSTRSDENGTDTIASGTVGIDGSGWVRNSDENGSSTMMNGSLVPGQPSYIGGTSTSNPTPKRANKPKPSKVGTYSFDGYTLTLRYSDGRIERSPAFFLDSKLESLRWNNGDVIRLDKPKTK